MANYEDHTREEWDLIVEEWHKSTIDVSLQEFMGLNDIDYRKYLFGIAIPYTAKKVFTEFCTYHNNGEPIYFVEGRLYTGFDMLVDIRSKYTSLSLNDIREVERVIRHNMHLFNVKETSEFYYPNNNMHSLSNFVGGIKGSILTLKESIYMCYM